MTTFDEYQACARQAPTSLRNDRDRISLPVRGLQEEAGRIGALLATAFASGRLELAPPQREEMKDRLADVLWYVASLCSESGLAMQEVAAHSIAQLEARIRGLDPDQR
jgi:NTP pyrophosphatase (non-canonical NTP hydrolase)